MNFCLLMNFLTRFWILIKRNILFLSYYFDRKLFFVMLIIWFDIYCLYLSAISALNGLSNSFVFRIPNHDFSYYKILVALLVLDFLLD